MTGPNSKSLLAGALLAVLLAAPAPAADVYKPYLDSAIPHHAAILDVLERLEKDPENAQLHNDLGCLVAWDGFWRDALRSFEKAAELAPKDSRPHFNAGLVKALRGEWRGARSRFGKAVKLDPGNWPAWWMLGLAHEFLGARASAIDAYSRSLRVDTSLFDPKVNPFAVATRLKGRVLLETYPQRRIDAALPFANQLSEPSRLAGFFQSRPRTEAIVVIEEPPKTGPVVTTVAPSNPVGQSSPPPQAVTPTGRRRRAYSESPAPVEVVPEAPVAAPGDPNLASPGTGVVPAAPPVPGETPTPLPQRIRRPGPGGAPTTPDEE